MRQHTAHIASYTYHAAQALRLVLTHAVQPKAGSSIAHAVSKKIGG